MVEDEIRAAYHGDRRDVYVRTLATYLADLGGRLDQGPDTDLVAHIGTRRIRLRFK